MYCGTIAICYWVGAEFTSRSYHFTGKGQPVIEWERKKSNRKCKQVRTFPLPFLSCNSCFCFPSNSPPNHWVGTCGNHFVSFPRRLWPHEPPQKDENRTEPHFSDNIINPVMTNAVQKEDRVGFVGRCKDRSTTGCNSRWRAYENMKSFSGRERSCRFAALWR